jgi:RNA polymerase sigma factor (TIGR02999 family)
MSPVHSGCFLPSFTNAELATERCSPVAKQVYYPLMPSSAHEVTGLLLAWNAGDSTALEKLTPLVYEELRRLARRYMGREQAGHPLQSTALVHEAYVRLIDASQVQWQNRAHFFAISANLMRRILVDFARSQNNQKRGGRVQHVPFEDNAWVSAEHSFDFAALDDALKRLAALDQRKSQMVELRFFGGLTVEETAEVLKVSRRTVLADWSFAKAWLLRELEGGGSHGDSRANDV